MKIPGLHSISDIPAKTLANVAIVIWLCSLALPGIDLYFQLYSQRHWLPGYEILFMGWLSPLVGNFAWFANLFFLYAFSQVKIGRVPVKSSIFAALLSLDTFRFDQYMMNEGGSTAPVYGFGWGAVLWFLSITILLTAVGAQQPDSKENLKRSEYEWLRPLGIFLTVAILGASGFFAIYDRIMANPMETQRLAGIAFKRGKVCRAPEPAAAEPIRSFSGTLEVVMDKSNIQTINANYPFRQIKDLLSWGIPTVRFYGDDYSYNSTMGDGAVTSQPASGVPVAILYIGNAGDRKINAKLVEVASSRVVFDQTWEKEQLHENSNFHYCPDYHSFPSANDQPRKLLVQALNLPTVEKQPDEGRQRTSIRSVEAVIAEEAEGGITRKMRFEQWKKEVDPHFKTNSGYMFTTSAEYHEWFNTNCPSDIGWDGNNRDTQQHTGWAFMVNGKAYYPTNRSGRNYATCADGVAYLYIGGMRDDKKYYLNITKRTLPEFQQTWAGIILIPNITSAMRDNLLEVQSIKEENGIMTIKLVNEDTGKVLMVQASLARMQ